MVLVQICRLHRNLVASALDQLKIHAGQDHALYRLAIAEGITQSELAAALCVDATTVAKTLARLERDRLIERRSNPDDGREWRVHLTQEGRALVRPVIDIWTEAEKRLTRGLSTADRSSLRRMLAQVLANLT